MFARLTRFIVALIALPVFLTTAAAGAASRPAVVLTAFGTSTAAADTYKHFEAKVRERYPGYEVRWAFTSQKVRKKLKDERQVNLPDLPATLKDLKGAGFTRVVVQSLLVVPGEEWQEMAKESGSVPGLKVSLGTPLLSSPQDNQQVLAALAPDIPKDLQKTAVVLVGHGSPHPAGESAYLSFQKVLNKRYPGQPVFLGVISGKPTRQAALDGVKKSPADTVIFIPFLFVAGEHVNTDILGDKPDSWKSELLTHKTYAIQGSRRGLGYQPGIIEVYLKHLEEALQVFKSDKGNKPKGDKV